jgi:hypothetical protein
MPKTTLIGSDDTVPEEAKKQAQQAADNVSKKSGGY